MGSPETAASRLTLTNALNSLATVIAPIFVSMLIVSANTGGASDPKTVQGPFAGIGIVTLIIVVVMFFLKLPEIKGDESTEGLAKKFKSSAYKYPHMWLGSLAIFLYGSKNWHPQLLLDYKQARVYFVDEMKMLLGWYWLGLMIGRLWNFYPALVQCKDYCFNIVVSALSLFPL
jgi:FHS family L-fucose permease-like MFS transporter